MATLETRLRDLATRIGTECKAIRALIASSAGAAIDDATTAAGTTWSSTKIAAERAAVKAEILGAAGAAYDTLEELKAYADSGQAADQVALGNRVRFDAAQSLTAPQKVQAKANIDAYGTAEIGNPDTDLVAVFNTAAA
jgi:hypothetical protein